jgi:hypothetical protein
MKYLTTTLILFLSFGCGQTSKKTDVSMDNSVELYNTFDKDSHLQPDFNKSKFDTLHSWDFGWAILEPLNIASDKDKEKELSRKLSPGQKALYFFWYLDAEVTNGGFIQFYWNGYRQYIPPILDGLKLIGDSELIDLVKNADQEYLANKDKFILQREKDNWEPLYNDLKEFEKFDEQYYKIHDKTMELIEKYARQNPSEFLNLK